MKHHLHCVYSICIQKHKAIFSDNAKNVTLNIVKCTQMSFLQWKCCFVYFTPLALLSFVNRETLSV